MTPDSALVFCRFLFYCASIYLWGAWAYLYCLVPPELARAVDRELRAWSLAATVLVIATTAALLPLRAATIGTGWADAVDVDTLRSVLFETNVGLAWLVQASAVVMLCAASFWLHRYRQCARAVCAALLLCSLTMTGHAAMHDGLLRVLHRANDALHMLAGGAWLGALVPVLRILAKLGDIRWQSDARRGLMRFSTAGHVAVALVIMTGIVNMILIIGGPPTDWSLEYQRLLCVKIVAVAAMVTLAVLNRYVLVPRLFRNSSMEALKWSIITGIGLGLTAIALVAFFGILQPV